MKLRSVLICLFAVLFWAVPQAGFSQEFKIGVLANRGAQRALTDWKPTADYLSAKTGKSFVITPLDYDQLLEWTKEKKIDFVLTNSAMYAELNKTCGIEAVATQVNRFQDEALDKFGSLILVRHDSPVEKLSDLKGKSFGCASRSAFGGWLMTARLLRENGINPDSNLTFIRELKTHDYVVYAVLNGAVDAGSVRTGSLEKMSQEGKIKISDFKVIHRISDDFPLMHSTQLYPEYPMAACRHVPSDVRTAVSKLMISLTPAEPAIASAKIFGWKEPMDYRPVVECLALLKYGAFKDFVQEPMIAAKEADKADNPAPPQEAGQVKADARNTKGRAVPVRTMQ